MIIGLLVLLFVVVWWWNAHQSGKRERELRERQDSIDRIQEPVEYEIIEEWGYSDRLPENGGEGLPLSLGFRLEHETAMRCWKRKPELFKRPPPLKEPEWASLLDANVGSASEHSSEVSIREDEPMADHMEPEVEHNGEAVVSEAGVSNGAEPSGKSRRGVVAWLRGDEASGPSVAMVPPWPLQEDQSLKESSDSGSQDGSSKRKIKPEQRE